MAYKKRSERKHAFGGVAEKNEHQYNAQGSPEEKSEHAKSEGFKRGGAKRAKGGHVEGEGAKHHMGHRARGGSVGRKSHNSPGRGGSPFSSGRSKSGPDNSKGSPGETAPLEP